MKVIDIVSITDRYTYVNLHPDYESGWGDENPYGAYLVNDIPWLFVNTVSERDVLKLAVRDISDVEGVGLDITYQGV